MDDAAVRELVTNLNRVIINPLIALVFTAGLLVFVWGIIEYMWGLSTDAKNRDEGKMHMLWGIIGMFVMVAAYSILQIIAGTLKVPLPHP